MATYTKETALYDTGAIATDIADAETKATNYLTNVSGGGVMVHPENDSTSGWKISSALELLKGGVTFIKAWLAGTNSDIPTVQIGTSTGQSIIQTPTEVGFADNGTVEGFIAADSNGMTIKHTYTENTLRLGTDGIELIDQQGRGVTANGANLVASGDITAIGDLDAGGDVRTRGDVYVGCNADFTGGISLSSPTAITLTRTNNSYVNSTSFDRLKCYRIGNLAILYCNLQITTSLPSNSTFVKIGTMSVAPKYDVNLVIPCQTTQTHVLLSVNTNGEIQIWNGCGTATGVGFFRAMVPFIVG